MGCVSRPCQLVAREVPSAGETPPSFLFRPQTRIRYGGNEDPSLVLCSHLCFIVWRGESLSLTGVAASSACLGDHDSQGGLGLQSPVERKLWQTVFSFLNNFHPCGSVIEINSFFCSERTCGASLLVLICCSPSEGLYLVSSALGYL